MLFIPVKSCIMNKFILSLVIAMVYCVTGSGQVDNYALKLTTPGTVDYGQLPELDNLNTYTLQFWINPSVWTSGAKIFSRGEGANLFAVQLGAGNTLELVAGTEVANFTSADLEINRWSQVTVINNQGDLKFYINNKLIGSEIKNMPIPATLQLFKIGDGFEGRIDEFRVWNTAIEDTFFHLWRNTVNKHHPNWDNLLVYYKFDQNLCDNIVDYKFNHHGAFSAVGAIREKVSDNTLFKYRRSVAYTDFARWADRQIDKDKYLLSNDLIVLSLEVDATGNATIPYSYNEGTVTNGGYLLEYAGRQGVLALNGAGAAMSVGTDALNPTDKYSFSTWIYLEEWTEGAYIFKKEKSDTEGFSIRLGDEARHTIIIRANGVDYLRPYNMEVNKWMHLGVAAYSNNNYQVFQTTFNGSTTYAINPEVSVHNYKLSGLESTEAYIGIDLNAKFDETVLWNAFRSSDNMAAAMTDTPMPSDTRKVEAQTLFTFDSYWNYDDPENVGYDSYSYKHFISVMRSNYAGHRGFMIRGGFKSFNGWENSFGDPVFRAKFADEVARVAQEFDGIDLDFEWCYSGTCWDNYGKVIEAVRAKFPADKVLTVTPHYVSYQLPAQYVDLVDYFPFQIYGPGKNVFLWSTYVDALNRFTTYNRYPKEKIVLSYATTTSRGYDPVTDAENVGVPSIGVRNDLLENGYSPEMNSVIDANGWRRYITGYNQVIDRCEFIQDNDLGGIMYWDMGNDVKTSHPYSLVKAASYSLNSNVDLLITEVDMTPTAVNDMKGSKGQLSIYPNPVSQELSIQMPAGEHSCGGRIYNVDGRLVKTFGENKYRLNLSEAEDGLYFIQVESDKNKRYTSKFIIK